MHFRRLFCLSGRIGPGGARGILFGRGASSIAGAAVARCAVGVRSVCGRCAVGAAARIRVYDRQVGIPDTFKGWPPGLLSSTTGEQIDSATQARQAGGCSPQRPKQTDDTTGSPRSLSDTFGRGIARLLGDRRNLGRFHAIAGQWRATLSEGWPPGLLASTIEEQINAAAHDLQAGSCSPQQKQGRGCVLPCISRVCLNMPNLAPLRMVWGGVISNEGITQRHGTAQIGMIRETSGRGASTVPPPIECKQPPGRGGCPLFVGRVFVVMVTVRPPPCVSASARPKGWYHGGRSACCRRFAY